jgi:guanylate cyclase soluble subunit beta
MLGLINQAFESFVREQYGDDVWADVQAAAGVHASWVSSCPYSDAVTYK